MIISKNLKKVFSILLFLILFGFFLTFLGGILTLIDIVGIEVLKNMNKTKKKCIFVLLGLFVLMMTVSSVNADEDNLTDILEREDVDADAIVEDVVYNDSLTGEEPILISPNSNTDEEPLVIATLDSEQNDSNLSEENALDAGLILLLVISGIVALAVALIVFKK